MKPVGQIGREEKKEEEKEEENSSISGYADSIAMEVPWKSGLSHLNSIQTDSNIDSRLSSQLHAQGMDSNISKTVTREKKKKTVPQNTLVK